MKLPRAICTLCGKGGPRHRGYEKGSVRPNLVTSVWFPPFYAHPACVREQAAAGPLGARAVQVVARLLEVVTFLDGESSEIARDFLAVTREEYPDVFAKVAAYADEST